MQKILVRVGAVIAATVCAIGTVTLPAQADHGRQKPPQNSQNKHVKTYVALGDSYAAGVGTGSSVGDCGQSEQAYPALLARATGWKLDFRACSGADVAKVAGQVPQMATHAEIVTVTAGGNDAGFADILSVCAQGTEAQCALAIHDFDRRVIGQRQALPKSLKGLYRDIKRVAPRAKVVVVGYPRLFDYQDCVKTPDGALHISVGEQAMLNAYTDRLNRVIAQQARASGAKFIDATRAFTGHGVCSKSPWINGYMPNVLEAFHPNVAGQAGYAALVARHLGVPTWNSRSAA